jgi:hypothetical protein
VGERNVVCVLHPRGNSGYSNNRPIKPN